MQQGNSLPLVISLAYFGQFLFFYSHTGMIHSDGLNVGGFIKKRLTGRGKYDNLNLIKIFGL